MTPTMLHIEFKIDHGDRIMVTPRSSYVGHKVRCIPHGITFYDLARPFVNAIFLVVLLATVTAIFTNMLVVYK